MKNIHVLPTDKPSRLFYNVGGALLFTNYENHNGVNIYITSDEEIKTGDWCFYVNSIYKVLRINSNNRPIIKMSDGTFEISYYRKIILTTDQDLIKDGVQAIDDEFLEWFVKNSSCESVGVTYGVLKPFQSEDKGYLIHYPDNEVLEEPKQDLEKEMFELEQELDIPSHLRWHNSKPKQETLEKAANNYSSNELSKLGFINGVKWQQERMYSKEDMKEAFIEGYKQRAEKSDLIFDNASRMYAIHLFETFKNK